MFRWRGTTYLAATGPSDRCDVLVAPGRDDVAAGLLAAVCGEASAHACARVDLKQLPPGSAWLEAPTPEGWRSRIEPGDVCPVAPLRGPQGLDAMPGKWRRKLGYTRRRAEALGGYTIDATGPATLREHQAALERLHADRWRERGEAGVLGGELQAALVREALPELARDGLLRFYVLRHDGEIAGVVLALQAHATLCFYAGGFDPRRSELGAGTLLIAHAIGAAAGEGATAADFLRGRERYKYHWGAVDTPTFRRVLGR
jgi:CelD/BcsL family acetyltransferase involved in cellulose biosynthesis